MQASTLQVPRQQSRPSRSERSEEDDFHALLVSIHTLLFTTSDRPHVRDAAVLAQAVHELERRWPEAGALARGPVAAPDRHRR